MKLPVLCLLVAAAAAVPFQADSGRDNYEVKQRDVLDLLDKIHEHSSQIEKTAQQFNPLEHASSYNDFSLVETAFKGSHHLEKHHYFNLFDPVHRKEAVRLFEVFMTAKTYDDFHNTACWARQHCNEGVFSYAFIVAVLNRPDTDSVQLPPLYEINPHYFTTTDVINKAYSAKMKQTPVQIDQHYTGTALNPEQLVAYFGEDIGLNNHHFHWHADFPFWWKRTYDIQKDRKGELFFYAHHVLTNRFDHERLSNHLPVVEPLAWEKSIKQGFNPQTTYKYQGEFPFRPDNQHFQDLPFVTINDLQHYEQRIKEAIAQGYVFHRDGHHISINNTDGINTLGQVVESSSYSPNVNYYGSLHNLAHVVLSRVSDPQGKYGLPPGVMEHFETATRDPSFFRLHKYMDNIFKDHKNWLPPYSHEELNFHGVTVQDVHVVSGGKTNELRTFFENFQFDLANAIDSSEGVPEVDITSNVQRLNHDEFDYKIKVHSNSDHTSVVRIFLAPTHNYYGELMDDEEQRWLFVEMDRFTQKLVAGDNVITRSSKDSSVTIPDRLGFKQMRAKLDAGELKYEEKKRHCGHPHRLLLPKGTTGGMQFTLMVFLSDFQDDSAYSHDPDHNVGDSLSYCGALNEVIPDSKPMGYPLDRRIDDYEDFFENQNFRFTHVKIKHDEHH